MTFNVVRETLRHSVFEDLFSPVVCTGTPNNCTNNSSQWGKHVKKACFSGQPASSVHDLENGGAGANSPPLSLPSSNENLTLNSSSFVSAPRSNNDPLSRSLGGMEATNVFRRSLSNNNASGLSIFKFNCIDGGGSWIKMFLDDDIFALERRYQSNDSFGVDDIRNDG